MNEPNHFFSLTEATAGHHMDLRQLATFQAIVTHGSFVRAADELGYAQSTVTLHIQQLEAEIGTALFTRAGRKMALTEAGRTLREQSAAVLQQMERLEETMAGVATGMAGRLRIGAVEPAASVALLPLIVRFVEERPQIQISLEVGGTRGISDRVASGDLDLGFCSPPPAHPGVTFEPLYRETLAVLLPARHHLTQHETLRTIDLRGERLLLTEPTCAYRAAIEAALIAHGTNPYSGIEIGSGEGLKRAVQRGLGLAILPESALAPPPEGTVARRFTDLTITLAIGIVRRVDTRGTSPALDAFARLLCSYLREK
jgi:DNA-binding transcriptional LysR family regulator